MQLPPLPACLCNEKLQESGKRTRISPLPNKGTVSPFVLASQAQAGSELQGQYSDPSPTVLKSEHQRNCSLPLIPTTTVTYLKMGRNVTSPLQMYHGLHELHRDAFCFIPSQELLLLFAVLTAQG